MLTVATATSSDIWPSGSGHPRAIEEQIIKVARTEITAADVEHARRNGTRMAAWYMPFYLAEQRVLAREQAAEDLRTKEIEALRQRVRALEAWFAPDKHGTPRVMRDTLDVVAEVVAQVRKDLRKEIEARPFEALNLDFDYDGERMLTIKSGDCVKSFTMPIPLDAGVWKVGTMYVKGDAVSFGGSVWIAKTATSTKPGSGSPDWRLSVKHGRDGRDGKDAGK